MMIWVLVPCRLSRDRFILTSLHSSKTQKTSSSLPWRPHSSLSLCVVNWEIVLWPRWFVFMPKILLLCCKLFYLCLSSIDQEWKEAWLHILLVVTLVPRKMNGPVLWDFVTWKWITFLHKLFHEIWPLKYGHSLSVTLCMELNMWQEFIFL